MNWSLNAWLLIGVFVLGPVCLAANKKEDEGKALIDRAKHVSDIRVGGATSFRLKVSFRIFKPGSATKEGTYTETWASKGQWRRETVLGDYSQTIVANGKKLWTLKKGSIAPTELDEVGFLMEQEKFFSLFLKPEKIEDRTANSAAVRCIETGPNLFSRKDILCFDKSTATIVAKTVSDQVEGRFIDNECTYGDYQKFGEKMFPRTIRCLEDHALVFDEAVIELVAEPTLDTTLFKPLTDGKESANCPGDPAPPKEMYAPNPDFSGHENPKNPAVLSLIVGTDGRPRDIMVERSVDKDFDAAALAAVQGWRFNPGTCDGEPIETTIKVEVNFRSF